jgi:3-keto-disaccharide hydrolase
MTIRQNSFAVFAVLVWTAAVFGQNMNALTAQEKAQGWQLLFDGKTLNGWHSAAPAPARGRAAAPAGAPTGAPAPARAGGPAPGQTGSSKPCVGARGAAAAVVPAGGSHWEVVDGLLTACGDPAGYLVSDQSYKNFVLSIEFKTAAETNSGVYVRSPKESGGYEVQIWRQQPAGYNTGAIVGTGKTVRDYTFKANEWNRFEITADGDHLTVVLNGEKTLDVHDARFPEGNIRLQYQQFPIQFRNIKIRPLP